jgi:hypothetical protein
MVTARRVLLVTLAFAGTTAMEAEAQECLGYTAATRAYASYGVEGTDGVTGQALTVGMRWRDLNLQLHGRVMDPNAISVSGSAVDGRTHTVQLQAAHPITNKLPLCVFGGLGWTGYDMQRFNGAETVTGAYTQYQVPLGISLGKEFQLTDRLSLTTFAQNAVLYQFENLSGAQAFDRKQHTIGIGMAAGLGLSYGPLMLRSTISNYKTLNNGIGMYNDFPYMSLQIGVKF